MNDFNVTVTDSVVKTVKSEYNRFLKRDGMAANLDAKELSPEGNFSNSSITKHLSFNCSTLSHSDNSSLLEQTQQTEQRITKGELVAARAKIASLEHSQNQLESTVKRAKIEHDKEITNTSMKHEKEKAKWFEYERKLYCVERERDNLREQITEINENNERKLSKLFSDSYIVQNKYTKLEKEKLSFIEKINDLELKLLALAKENNSLQIKVDTMESDLNLKSAKLDEALKFQIKNQNLNDELIEIRKKLAETEKKFIEQKVSISNFEEDSLIVRLNKKKLESIPKLEREVRKWREEYENAKEFNENVSLLREQLQIEENKVQRLEEHCRKLNSIEVEYEHLKKQIERGGIKKVADIEMQLQDERTSHQIILLKNGELMTTVSILEHKLDAKQKEFCEAKDSLIKQEGINKELNDRLKRMKLRLDLGNKERDSLVSVIESFKAQLDNTLDNHSENALDIRVKEMEKVINEYKQHIDNIQKQLDEKSTELFEQKTISHRLNAKLKNLSMQNNANISSPITPPNDRKLIEHLRNQLQIVESELDVLKKEKTKHDEKYGLQIQDFDTSKLKVIHMKENPLSNRWRNLMGNLELLKIENVKLKNRLAILEENAGNNSLINLTIQAEERATIEKELTQKVTVLKDDLTCERMKSKRLEEEAKKTIHDLKKSYYELTGWKLYKPENKIFKVVNDKAVCTEHSLFFKQTEIEGVDSLMLLKNNYSDTLQSYQDSYLSKEMSIPAFLAAITLDLFNYHHNDSTLMT